MNIVDNHLIKLATGQEMLEGYEPLPAELMGAAIRALGPRREVTISRHSGGQISRWAAGRRKARRKMAAASRKKNRERR